MQTDFHITGNQNQNLMRVLCRKFVRILLIAEHKVYLTVLCFVYFLKIATTLNYFTSFYICV